MVHISWTKPFNGELTEQVLFKVDKDTAIQKYIKFQDQLEKETFSKNRCKNWISNIK